MTIQDAAESMRVAARKMETWSRAARQMREPDMEAFEQVLAREASRLRRDADELHPVLDRGVAA